MDAFSCKKPLLVEKSPHNVMYVCIFCICNQYDRDVTKAFVGANV